ncbi:hypothetical protein PMIT1327_00154 [Prochlorococcus marinus str. MIT 1327]|nr:hypothetical protein PMIT1312_00334 [Prochlorococcus marinus str. MIT 1312]KZR84239.1 hypothetical protein PMIT1327_00154 [Prochlorococcus marinus str. MIT 1327]
MIAKVDGDLSGEYDGLDEGDSVGRFKNENGGNLISSSHTKVVIVMILSFIRNHSLVFFLRACVNQESLVLMMIP